MNNARARSPNPTTSDGGIGTSGIPNVASGSRSVTMGSSEIARIIQEEIKLVCFRILEGQLILPPTLRLR